MPLSEDEKARITEEEFLRARARMAAVDSEAGRLLIGDEERIREQARADARYGSDLFWTVGLVAAIVGGIAIGSVVSAVVQTLASRPPSSPIIFATTIASAATYVAWIAGRRSS